MNLTGFFGGVGDVQNVFPPPFKALRAPTIDDKKYRVGQFWNYEPGRELWLLLYFDVNGDAIWVRIGTTPATLLFLEGDTGGPVEPSPAPGNTIFLEGGPFISVTGDPVTYTLTWDNTLVGTLTADSGGAIGVDGSNNIGIVGAGGISTSGAGNTITITGAAFGQTITGDTGGAVPPTSGNWDLLGGAFISVDGDIPTSTLVVNNTLVGTLTGDSGGAIGIDANNNINVVGGTDIEVTGSGNTLTITYNGSALDNWTNVTTTPFQLVESNGYTADSGSTITFNLPATATYGTRIRICGKGTGGWTIAQAASQQINYGVASTTSGAGGSLSSSAQFDVVELLASDTDTWTVLSSIGNLTVV